MKMMKRRWFAQFDLPWKAPKEVEVRFVDKYHVGLCKPDLHGSMIAPRRYGWGGYYKTREEAIEAQKQAFRIKFKSTQEALSRLKKEFKRIK